MTSMRLSCVVVLVVAAVACVHGQVENAGVRAILRVYDECSKAEGFAPCLKKKALTFMDRLARMEKFSVLDGVTVIRANDVPAASVPVSEEQLESTLPRGLEAREAVLDDMLMDKAAKYISSRTIQITLPQFDGSELGRGLEEGRGKMKKMMGMMMMGVAAKMAGFIPLALAGLFLLAGKALIIAKIALLLSGIIAVKKLIASKQSGGGGGHGSSGHGGWQSSGGGWDKRSYDEAQKMAYKAYVPQ